MDEKKYYGIKDIEELLGIKRSTIRHWEEIGLLNKPSRNVINNSYREYTKEDLNSIWAIKLLRGIGYTTTEIQENIIGNENFDFYKSISKKVEELEKQENEARLYLEFAKTIEMTGRVPTVEIGTMRFEDFIEYSRKEWNFFKDDEFVPGMEKIIEKKIEDYTEEDLNTLLQQLEKISVDYIYLALEGCKSAYWRVFSTLKNCRVSDEIIKNIFISFCDEINQKYTENTFGRKLTINEIAKYLSPNFMDNATTRKENDIYGKETLQFIAEIFEYYENYKEEENES